MATKTKIILEGHDNVSPVVKTAEQNINQLTKQIKAQGKVLADLGTAIKGSLVVGAFTALTGAVADSIKQYTDAEKQQQRMRAIFANTGDAIGVNVYTLDDLADKYKKLANVDDDEIRSMESVLLATNNMTKDGFEPALKAALDLSAGLGIDSVSATQMLSKAIADPTAGMTALNKAEVRLTEQQKKAVEEFVNIGNTGKATTVILGAIEGKFGDVSNEMANLDGAKFDRLKMALDDLSKYAGHKFADLLGGIADSFAGFVNDNVLIQSTRDAYNENKKGIDDLVKASRNLTDSDIASNNSNYISAEKKLKALEKSLGMSVTQLRDNAKEAISKQLVPDDYLVKLSKNLDIASRISATSLDRSSAGGIINSGATEKAEKDAKSAADAAKYDAEKRQRLRAYYLEADGLVQGEVDANTEYMDQYWSDRKKRLDEYYQYANELVLNEVQAYQEEIAGSFNKNFDQAVSFANQSFSAIQGVYSTWIDMENQRSQAVLANYDKELKTASDKYNAEKKAKQDLGEETTAIDDAYAAQKADLEAQRLAKENEFAQKAFEANKVNQIASATMSTANAVISALGMFPFTPVNLALAGIVGGLGAVQIGMIASQSYTPKFADGGIVPGSKFFGDKILSRLNSGEMVLNNRQQSNLFDIANGAQSGRTPQQINVYVSGAIGAPEEVARAIHNEIVRQQDLGNIGAN